MIAEAYARALQQDLVTRHHAKPEHAAQLAASICENLTVSEAGVPVVIDRFGHALPETVGDLISRERQANPGAFGPATPSPAAPAASTAPASNTDQWYAARGLRAPRSPEQHDADRIAHALRVSNGNPWKSDHRTGQVLIEHLDPAQAARLRAEAGLR